MSDNTVTRRHSAQHRATGSGHSLWAGLASTAAGATALIAGITLLLKYSEYEHPGYGPPGALLSFLGLVLLAVPPLAAAARRAGRYRTWKAALPPAQRALVNAAEVAALTGTAIVLHEYNEKTRERLAASVMGGSDE